MVQRRKRKVVQTGRGECVGGRIVSQGCTIGRKGDRTQDLPELSSLLSSFLHVFQLKAVFVNICVLFSYNLRTKYSF